MSPGQPSKRGFRVPRGTGSVAGVSLPSQRRQPLRDKNCQLSAFLSTAEVVKPRVPSRPSHEEREEAPLTAFPQALLRRELPDERQQEERHTVAFDRLVKDSKVVQLSQELSQIVPKIPYHRRRITEHDKGTTSMVYRLSRVLWSFNTKIQVAKIHRQFDLLVDVERLELLSSHEILVVTADGGKGGKRAMILHSTEPLQGSHMARLLNLRLAINSKCYLELCNDIIWYLRWKFF